MEAQGLFIITFRIALRPHILSIIKFLLTMRLQCIQTVMITLKCTIRYKITRRMEKWLHKLPQCILLAVVLLLMLMVTAAIQCRIIIT